MVRRARSKPERPDRWDPNVSIEADDFIDFRQLIRRLAAGKWLFLGIVVVCVGLGVIYALTAPPVYRAEVVLAPVSSDRVTGGLAQMTGLASLAGIDLGVSGDKTHALAMLQSRWFIQEFIRERNLLPVLFSELWDSNAGTWKNSDPAKHPDVRDGVALFDRKVRFISEDRRTGLVTLAIEWKDPEVAAEWAKELVRRINEDVRQRDIRESESKLQYLNEQLEKASLLELRQAIARVIEGQISSMMVAQAQPEYAFSVIDPAVVPKDRVWPKRTLIVIVSFVLGGVIGALVVLSRTASGAVGADGR